MYSRSGEFLCSELLLRQTAEAERQTQSPSSTTLVTGRRIKATVKRNPSRQFLYLNSNSGSCFSDVRNGVVGDSCTRPSRSA